MYVPRGKLLALVTIVVAAALVTGTGAFSSVETERTAEVQVAGDSNAYLGLQGTSAYADEQNDGKLSIDFDDSAENVTGDGVNPDSVTTFDEVFTIVNQGTETVGVTVESSGEDISIYNGKTSENINGKEIGPGDDIVVGFEIDATGKTVNSGNISEEITISAVSSNVTKEASHPDTGSSSSDSSGDSDGDSDESEE